MLYSDERKRLFCGGIIEFLAKWFSAEMENKMEGVEITCISPVFFLAGDILLLGQAPTCSQSAEEKGMGR